MKRKTFNVLCDWIESRYLKRPYTLGNTLYIPQNIRTEVRVMLFDFVRYHKNVISSKKMTDAMDKTIISVPFPFVKFIEAVIKEYDKVI